MKPGVPKTQSEVKDLKRLRQLFLSAPERPGTSDYWSDDGLLDLYDATFARRIAWKWDAVLGELTDKGWTPKSEIKRVIDWGCGSGVASEIFLKTFEKWQPETWIVSDRSERARKYSSKKIQDMSNDITVIELPPSSLSFQTGDLVLISHILTELTPEQVSALQSSLMSASAVIWVEPGTPFCSQRIISIRDKLIQNFNVISPCPHKGHCGLSGESRDWCHFFAQPPSYIFQDSDLTRFAKEMEIDLRSLPVSFLVLESQSQDFSDRYVNSAKRVIGRPRFYKGYAKLLVCDSTGVNPENILEKKHKEKFKKWQRDSFCLEFTNDLDCD